MSHQSEEFELSQMPAYAPSEQQYGDSAPVGRRNDKGKGREPEQESLPSTAYNATSSMEQQPWDGPGPSAPIDIPSTLPTPRLSGPLSAGGSQVHPWHPDYVQEAEITRPDNVRFASHTRHDYPISEMSTSGFTLASDRVDYGQWDLEAGANIQSLLHGRHPARTGRTDAAEIYNTVQHRDVVASSSTEVPTSPISSVQVDAMSVADQLDSRARPPGTSSFSRVPPVTVSGGLRRARHKLCFCLLTGTVVVTWSAAFIAHRSWANGTEDSHDNGPSPSLNPDPPGPGVGGGVGGNGDCYDWESYC